jgi:hypothetical protein
MGSVRGQQSLHVSGKAQGPPEDLAGASGGVYRGTTPAEPTIVGCGRKKIGMELYTQSDIYILLVNSLCSEKSTQPPAE